MTLSWLLQVVQALAGSLQLGHGQRRDHAASQRQQQLRRLRNAAKKGRLAEAGGQLRRLGREQGPLYQGADRACREGNARGEGATV